MKYVIWGAGYRGKLLLKSMKKCDVIAFVDSNKSLSGREINNIQVISPEDYLLKYRLCLVVISTIIWKEEIINFLEKNGIYNYLEVDRSPTEVVFWGGRLPYREMLEKKQVDLSRSIALYGINLFSLMLYDYLISIKVDVKLIYVEEQYYLCENVKKIDPNYAFVSLDEVDDCLILITNKHINKLEGKSAIAFYNFGELDRYKYNKMDIFFNKHKRKRCFIVGNGPSVRLDDLSKLHKNNEITFGVNSIYEIFDKIAWRPTYYVTEDGPFYEGEEKVFSKIDVQTVFLGDVYQKKINKNNVYWFHLFRDYYDERGPEFSFDINNGVYSGGTVLYSCIQIAAYMGFENIYIIGADCDYNEDDENYFFCFDQSKYPKAKLNISNVFSAYRKARLCLNEHNINIYNATRGGKLEELERVDFDSLFE